MNETLYASVLEKAQAALAERSIPNAPVEFKQIRVPVLYVKVFRLITRAKRKLMRRFQK